MLRFQHRRFRKYSLAHAATSSKRPYQSGGSKNRNPRNPWNPPKFTKSSVY